MKARVTFHKDGTQSYFLDGVEVTEREYRRRMPDKEVGPTAVTKAYVRPRVSTSEGVHPSQVQEHNEWLKKNNVVGAHYRPDGRAVFESNSGREDLCRAVGTVDFNGGYSGG